VLCGDESPVNVLVNDLDDSGIEVAGAPHAVTVWTPDTRLVWYTAMTSRSKTSIAGLDVLTAWRGYLVRDDYAGWHQFDPHLAGVQQCAAHIIRHCKGVLELHPDWQKWARGDGVGGDPLAAAQLLRLRGARDGRRCDPSRHRDGGGTNYVDTHGQSEIGFDITKLSSAVDRRDSVSICDSRATRRASRR
jgi:hypothetical protein